MSSPTESETKLIDEIVCKVKSEGLFDQFRRECLADADTKPAFLNVQQRVEAAVGTFLDDTEWTARLNKNQLREKLRKSITNEAFFEAGIERIVDQVVNPKLNSNLVPKCQDVAYKFLGIEKPLFIMNFDVKTEMDTELPLELEQVDSPESDDKSMALHPPGIDDDYIYEKADDFESPAFEPIETVSDFKVKHEFVERQDDDMDISDGDDVPLQMNGSTLIQNDEAKSNLSSISGLTSSDSQADCMAEMVDADRDIKMECNSNPDESPWNDKDAKEQLELLPPQLPEQPCLAPEISVDTAHKLPRTDENVISADVMIENMSHDSVLSQVSSTSRLSIVTNNNTNTRMDDGDSNHTEIGASNYENTPTDQCPYGISEEAQMQKFNESSSSNNSLIIDTDNVSNGAMSKADTKVSAERMTSFDIKRQEIKFEGTSRKSIDLTENGDSKQALTDAFDVNSTTPEGDQNKASEAPKFEETESTGSQEKPELSLDLKGLCDDKSINNIDTDDSKPTDESSSSNHKVNKERHRDGKTSSSTRNGNDSEHHKQRSKDRSHHSSSKDRHRDKDKDRKSLSSSSKDKLKSVRDESESRDSTSKHRDSTSSSSKHSSSKHDDHNRSSHHKSNSSSSSSKEKSKSDKHSVSSTSSNSHSSSKLKDKDHTRHSTTTSTSSKDKDISKRDSKHSDSKRHRSESHRASSKKDDHYTHKEKSTPRQRSRSKDSNDGNHRLSQSSIGVPAQPCTSAAQASSSIEKAEAGSSTKEPQPITSHTAIATTSEAEASVTADTPKPDIEINKLRSDAAQIPTSSQEDSKFVMVTQPVRVDQILTGKELNLGIFIDENRDDPVVSSIEQSLEPAAKKPKVAANMAEARRLAKVRKEIELDEQKKVEKAMVLAKQHIRTNAATLRDDSNQGIELEFVCVNSVTGEGKTTGPTISSPIKYANGVKLPEMNRLTQTATVTSAGSDATDQQPHTPASCDESDVVASPMDTVHSSDDDMDDFFGFDENDIKLLEDQLKLSVEPEERSKRAVTKARLKGSPPNKRIGTLMNVSGGEQQQQLYDMLSGDDQLLFLENNKIGKNGLAASKLINRKRKADHTVTDVASSSSELNATNDDMIVASVVISQTNNECNDKPDSSTRSETDTLSALEKQRQKTRYSKDDLFKPRPVLSGGSRSRRRGINCNE